MLSPKFKIDARRVVCKCQSHGCYKGFHLDASGLKQQGIEVIPATKESHTRADLRFQIMSTSPPVNPDNSNLNQPAPIDEQDQLSATLARLGLDPSRSSSDRATRIDSRSISAPINFNSLRATFVADRLSEPEEDMEGSSSATHVPSDSNEAPDVCKATDSARQNGLRVYDSSRFHVFTLSSFNPVCLHVALTAAVMSIFDHSTMTTSAWLMDMMRVSVELSITVGLVPRKTSTSLNFTEIPILQRFPRTITTAIGWLKIDPLLIYMNCCKRCFALYSLCKTPTWCNHQITSVPGGSTDHSTETNIEINTEAEEQSSVCDQDFEEETCGEPLLRFFRGQQVPVRRYAFQDLSEWIARLYSRPFFEEWLDESLVESRRPFNPNEDIHDIHGSRVWKEFCGPDGQQFTATSGNLVFGMFIDGINPFGNKQSGHHDSITFIVLICLTLPIRVRNRPENIFLVGIAPGPREPALEQINWILKPIVAQLQTLWESGLLLSKTHHYKNGRVIRAALLVFIADIPALRRSLGFPSATNNHFCSFCLLEKKDIQNFDQATWPIRTCSQHKVWAYQARDAKTVKERKTIFKTHGVRYSVLNDLEYWNIVDFHVVDSMHNLLLGLLSWHLRRFWSMTDMKNDEDELPPVTKKELLDLFVENSNFEQHQLGVPDQENPADNNGGTIHNISSTDLSGESEFDPLGDPGWDSEWISPPLGEVIFDKTMLQTINSLLPRIHIPTWIKRAIPVVGKASFGKLKADEWRNLFTIQLPLTLIPIWSGHDHVKTALLKNFCHLVSLVNLALKRVMNENRIKRYRHHIQEYLKGSIVLFQHCNLAPNHHMAIHLADCLERFGPVRAWWSFPFERLMGRILKSCHNNHIGELEITFMKNFCRAGNLSALIKDNQLPDTLKPYAKRLESLYDPPPAAKKKLSNSKLEPIPNSTLVLLAERLNEGTTDRHTWVLPDQWCHKSKKDSSEFMPITPRAFFYKQIEHLDVYFASFTSNPNNSFITFNSTPNKIRMFGRIFSIFVHRRSPAALENIVDTWIHVQIFPPVPAHMYNRMIQIDAPDVQVYLRAWGPTENIVINVNDMISHCSWIMYKPCELHKNLNIATVALVSMER